MYAYIFFGNIQIFKDQFVLSLTARPDDIQQVLKKQLNEVTKLGTTKQTDSPAGLMPKTRIS